MTRIEKTTNKNGKCSKELSTGLWAPIAEVSWGGREGEVEKEGIKLFPGGIICAEREWLLDALSSLREPRLRLWSRLRAERLSERRTNSWWKILKWGSMNIFKSFRVCFFQSLNCDRKWQFNYSAQFCKKCVRKAPPEGKA